MADPRGQEQIAADYRRARDARDPAAMRRLQNEEACLVLLAILERLAFEKSSFIRDVALKGGILMVGELHSPRSSADIDATTGHMQRLDADQVITDLRRAGRTFNVRPDGQPEGTAGGLIVHFRFDSLTDSGTAKLEVSVREDLVFAVRDAFFDVSSLGIAPFEVHAVAQVELVAEKLRTVVQRAQPRDLFDLRFYLVESGWHLDPADLRKAVDAKLALTRYRRWRPGLWRNNVDAIEAAWETTLLAWIDPDRLPSFSTVLSDVARRLRELRLD
ncbi:MAG TPA: nucleotidyl transferase AbiEii/AbiGii toxin family protein [Clostridia bacterium]|nr:nucleotidyl transferase AbiEii/AbiGii toxin family protein [Clostridia bacterium]